MLHSFPTRRSSALQQQQQRQALSRLQSRRAKHHDVAARSQGLTAKIQKAQILVSRDRTRKLGIGKLFRHTGLHVSGKQRDRAKQSSVVAELCGDYLDLAPRRPRVLLYVRLNVRKDDLSTAHHAAAHDDPLRIIGMNQSHRASRPNLQTVFKNLDGNAVPHVRQFKEYLEIYIALARQLARRETLPLAR